MKDFFSEQVHRIDLMVQDRMAELVELRRYLHANPELSRHEFETSALLKGRLEDLGFSVRVREEGTGLIADLTPAGFDPERHPTVAIRADIDALPIEELNEIAYCSQRDGVMHACGHDVHMACAMGASQALRTIRDRLPGRLRIVYQHAEEVAPSGASEMIAFGAIDQVDAIIALHCEPELPIGKIGIKPGPLTASFDRFDYTIKGTGGHGARPHHCVDPVFVATQLANTLYQLPGRRMDARSPVVLSIGEFHAGYAPNVIPESARITGTVRTVDDKQRAEMQGLLQTVADQLCALHGASVELDLYKGAPAINNNARVTDIFEAMALEVIGEDAIYRIPKPSMGSEDFSHFLQRIPGAMFRLGTAAPDRDVHLLHSARFDIDERAIGHGARILARTAFELLRRLAEDRDALA